MEIDRFNEDLYEEVSKYPPDETLHQITSELKSFGVYFKKSDFGLVFFNFFTLIFYNNHWFVQLKDFQTYRTPDASITNLCILISEAGETFEVNEYFSEFYYMKKTQKIINERLNNFVKFVRQQEKFFL